MNSTHNFRNFSARPDHSLYSGPRHYPKIPFFMGQGCLSEFYHCPTLGREWKTAFNFMPMPFKSLDEKSQKMRGYLRYLRYIRPDIIFGHSSGSAVALTLAKLLPSVEKLVLLAPSPMPGMSVPGYLQLRMLRSPRQYLWPVLNGQPFHLTGEDNRSLLLNTMNEWEQNKTIPFCGNPWSGSVIREMMFSSLSNSFDWSGLEDKEVFVFGGGADKMITSAFTKKVGQHIADKACVGVQYCEIPNAQHLLMCGFDTSFNLHQVFRKVDIRVPSLSEIEMVVRQSKPID